jgi:hypothetical protein
MAYLEDILPQIRAGRKATRKAWSTIGCTIIIPTNSTGIDESNLLADDWELVPEPKKIRAKINLWSNGAITTACCSEQITTRAKLIETRVIEWEVTE